MRTKTALVCCGLLLILLALGGSTVRSATIPGKPETGRSALDPPTKSSPPFTPQPGPQETSLPPDRPLASPTPRKLQWKIYITLARKTSVDRTAGLPEYSAQPVGEMNNPNSPYPAPDQTPAIPGPSNPGTVVAPILLYHHVAETKPASRYAISPVDFERQMKHLKSWGYTTISLQALSDALQGTENLPERPLIITFDDGYRDVYENAFPVMQQLGFTGVVYVISGQLKGSGTLHGAELKELIAAGWEVGSHSQSHLDLRTAGLDLNAEIAGSRQKLEKLLDTPVLTFSFPYGLTSPVASRLVRSAGYQTAVGVGGLFTHSEKMRYYLSRLEVQGGMGMSAFARLLPWSDEHPSFTQPTP